MLFGNISDYCTGGQKLQMETLRKEEEVLLLGALSVWNKAGRLGRQQSESKTARKGLYRYCS